MNVDIYFKDEKLNKIIKTIKSNYEQFNFCSMSVKKTDWIDSEDQEVTIKLKFSY